MSFDSACAEVLRRDAWTCQSCGTTTGIMHIDHIYPRSAGGSDHPSNLQVLCAPCNLAKGDHSVMKNDGPRECPADCSGKSHRRDVGQERWNQQQAGRRRYHDREILRYEAVHQPGIGIRFVEWDGQSLERVPFEESP